MKRTLALGLLALLWAGCTSPKEAPDADSTLGPVSAGPSFDPGAPAALAESDALPVELLWTNCQGIYTWFVWPLETNPATAFDGWEATPREATEVRMMAVECERVSWGDFVRGPIRFVFDYHNDLMPPPTCTVSTHHAWILNAVWTDDAEVADQLARVEGMPVQVSPIEVTVQGTAAVHIAAASWASSTLSVQQEPMDQEPAIMGLPLRLFWKNPLGGVSAVYFVTDLVDGPAYPSERLATGTIAAPMIMSNLAGGQYAGPGFMFYGGNFGGDLNRYEDLRCGQPA